jgi:hypothetical protein
VTDPNEPGRDPVGDLPPDLPPEYAEAYLRGYQRAWATTHDEPDPEPPVVEPFETAPSSPSQEPAELSLEDELFGPAEPFEAPPASPEWTGPTHRDPEEPTRQPKWLVPALLGAIVLALILSAYGVGKLFADDDPESGSPSAENSLESPQATTPGTPSKRPEPTPVKGEAWDGPVRPLSGVRGTATCVLTPSVDAGGRRVTYTPDKALDGDYTTAWRCAGNGRGVTITLSLSDTVRLAEVGIVPGYAKTDPVSGADRYAENNRITRVRWTFPDGRSIVQRLDGAPGDRRMQTLRIPPTETNQVTLEVLASVAGPRDTVAISEIQLSETVG